MRHQNGTLTRWQSKFADNAPDLAAFKLSVAEPVSGHEFGSLASIAHIDVWRLAALNLQEYQGPESVNHKPPWSLAKGRALSIVKLRSSILDEFEMVEGAYEEKVVLYFRRNS